MHKLDILEWVLVISLSIALLCSIIICFQVYIFKNGHYKRMFSTWQMPMIFALVADLYFIQ